MRSSAAIALVLLGGGVVATAVALPARCNDQEPAACPSGGHGTVGSWSGGRIVSTIGSVARGGFGRAGAAMSVAS